MFHTLVQCVLFFLTVYLFRLWYNRRKWLLLSRLPGPLNLPLIGAMYLVPGADTTEYHQRLIRLTNAYGSPWCLWLGPIPVVIVSTVEHARIILTSPATLEKASFYRFTPLRGIFSLPAHQWRPHRKIIQPSFKQPILRSFIPLFDQKSNSMVQALSAMSEHNEPFDIYRSIARCTLDMIFATTLNTDLHIQDAPTCGYLDVLEELFEIVTIRAVNILLHPQWLYRWTSVYRKERKALEEFYQPSQRIISERMVSRSICHSQADTTKPNRTHDLVDSLLASMIDENGDTDREGIEDELNAIVFAGNETSALTVANAILLIAMHPYVQEKLFEELQTHCGSDGTDVRWETLGNLTYMEMVLKESLRLLPVASIVGRKTTDEIDLGAYRVPADVEVIIDIFSIHRNPANWGADADRFRPERFVGLSYDNFALLAFSAGSRNCIGLRYSWISMKVMLVKVLSKYIIETDLKLEDLKMKLTVTTRIVNGHMVRLKRRQ